MSYFVQNYKGRLVVSKELLVEHGVYTDVSYRNGKSKGRFEEVELDGGRSVVLDSMPKQTQQRVMEMLDRLRVEYANTLKEQKNLGVDPSIIAIEFTAATLGINAPFLQNSIETYINANYIMYAEHYLEAGLGSDSVRGYARQCALMQWMHTMVCRIRNSLSNNASLMLRSFRMNMLTAISSMKFEVKIPFSETRFNSWFDDAVKQLDNGVHPHAIVGIKRRNVRNNSKISDEQLAIVLSWHTNGTNMSVPQLHDKWVEYGRTQGWWISDGKYCPPSESRLYQLLQPLKNPLKLVKTDNIVHRLSVVPAVSRELPKSKNHVWVIDGTAHNENVFAKGTVRQHVYAIKVMDVASMRLLGCAGVMGVREPFSALKESLLSSIRFAGHKPAIIHCDRGPAWKELEAWCADNDIRLYPSLPGNARAKTIESSFNQFDNLIGRYLQGYSGQNRTAVGSINSKPSVRLEQKGKRHARSAEQAIAWAQTEGIRLWNEHIIKTLERRKCGKTPDELWAELPSFTPALPYMQLAMICGTLHKRKLSVEGIEIQHNNKRYIYFPKIDTAEERAKAEQIYTNIPIDKRNANALHIYVLDGGEPAPVFSHTGKYLGLWEVKSLVGYTAGIDGDKLLREPLDNMMALQHRVVDKAKRMAQDIDAYVAKHPDGEAIERFGREALTNRRRASAIVGRYDKSALLEAEQDEKALEVDEYESEEYVDPDTGEIKVIRTLKTK